jgi:hypothetical protein
MIRKFFAVFLIIIFIPLMIAMVLAWNVKLTALNPSFLTQQLEKSDVYGKVEELTPKYLVEQLNNRSEVNGLTNLVLTPEIEESFKENFPKSWIQSNTENIINQTLTYVNSQSLEFDLQIDLGFIKNRLRNFLPVFLKPQIESLPVCQSNELSNDENITCRPSDMTSDAFAQQITDEIFKDENSFVSKIPDSYNLGNQLTNQGQVFSIAQARQNIQNFNFGLYLLSALVALIFILIGLLIFRPISSVLRWLGISLIIPGILLIPLSISRFFLPSFVQSALQRYPSDIVQVIQSLSSNISIGILNNILYVGLGLIILAIILFILSFIFKKRPKKAELSQSQTHAPQVEKPQPKIKEELKEVEDTPKIPIQKMPEPPKSIDTITSRTKTVKITPNRVPKPKQKPKSRKK